MGRGLGGRFIAEEDPRAKTWFSSADDLIPDIFYEQSLLQSVGLLAASGWSEDARDETLGYNLFSCMSSIDGFGCLRLCNALAQPTFHGIQCSQLFLMVCSHVCEVLDGLPEGS